MTVERSRPIRVPSLKGAFEQQLVDAIRAVKLPEPVREHHFDWCCECIKPLHGWERNPTSALAVPRCHGCPTALASHAYAKGRDWRFDLAWPGPKWAVEIDGGTYSGGRHTRGDGYEKDAEKLNEAVLRGWRVLRVTTKHVESGDALEWVERAFGRHQ